MKEIRKDNVDFFICEECQRNFKSKKGLSKHIKCCHDSTLKTYYDKWIKEIGEEICPICRGETKFQNSILYGYSKTCTSLKCSRKLTAEKANIGWIKKYGCHPKQTEEVKKRCIENNLKKYGIPHIAQLDWVKSKMAESNLKNHNGINAAGTEETIKKSKKTRFERYGNENYVNPEKTKETNLERYGNRNYNNRKKAGILNLERYGNVSPLHGKDQIEKCKKTWIEKYGVDHPMKNREFFEKAFKTRVQIHKYLDTNIKYQGTFELDFLKKYYDLFKENLFNGPSIPYILNEENRMYHSDFYISSLNLVIEIKNSYLYKRFNEEIKEKEKATKNLGYNYILILDKHYKEFNKKYVKKQT
jgi:hypothetical protein